MKKYTQAPVRAVPHAAQRDTYLLVELPEGRPGGALEPDQEREEGDAELITLAFQTANQVAKKGYDPFKAIEALPRLLRTLERISDATATGETMSLHDLWLFNLLEDALNPLKPENNDQ